MATMQGRFGSLWNPATLGRFGNVKINLISMNMLKTAIQRKARLSGTDTRHICKKYPRDERDLFKSVCMFI